MPNIALEEEDDEENSFETFSNLLLGYKDLKKKFSKLSKEHLSYDCKDSPKGPSKPTKTNKKGPNRICVPKKMIILIADLLDNRKETPVMVPTQWLLMSHDRKKVYVPRP
ncbi:hypothetical protein CR513_26771, partial [Mucuna pruriens]